MGNFKISKVDYCEEVKEILSSDPARSCMLEEMPKTYRKVGSMIRDKVFKSISSPIMTGFGYDGDVKGIDVDPEND